MSEETENLEKRLGRLNPLEQEALAAKILEDLHSVDREDPSTALPVYAPVFAAAPFAWPRSCLASLSLCSACVGAIVGAAATFLGMTYFVPPKVEIHEIVREVSVKAESASDVKAKPPETKLEADRRSPPVESGPENQPLAQPKPINDFDDRPTLSGLSFRDVDALVAEREAFAWQMGRRDSNVGSTSRGFVPPRISPEEYRELLRELKL
ncbi:MAG: hypothetical protein ACLP9L_25230 [Thermoguttaceae bacterium]